MGWLAPFICLALPYKDVLIEKRTTIRKVQSYSGDRSLTIVIPKAYAKALGFEKKDFLMVQMENDRLILQKAVFNEVENLNATSVIGRLQRNRL
jgi:antitoxin component of MazEF toxin-antitoxin module